MSDTTMPHLLPDLSATTSRETFADLCGMLPPQPDASPDARATQEDVAWQAVIALHPGDAFEARLAAQIVGIQAQAVDGLRRIGLAANDPDQLRRDRAWAVSMTRQADALLRSLLRLQAIREKQLRELNPAAMERAGYWFRDISVPAPENPPPAAEPAEPQPERDIAAEAERWVVICPDRSARIGAGGGLPDRLDLAPPVSRHDARPRAA